MTKRPGLVMLDGPDAVGKTTLAKALLDDDMAGYVHMEYWPDRELWRAQYFALYKAMIRSSLGLLTVIDRHWPSELIYSRSYREGTHMSAEARGWDRVMKRLCGVYVICAPNPASAASRHAEQSKIRKEMYKPSDTILQVAQRYYDLWYGNPFGHDRDYAEQLALKGGMQQRNDSIIYDIDVHGSNLRMFCGYIFAMMEALQDAQYPPALLKDHTNFLGHVSTGKFLFVGERINPRKTGRWPFIDFGASSRTLSNILHDLQFDEGEGLWTNAYARDEHVERLVAEYKLNVIALGNEASRSLVKSGVPHTTVFHPSYAKRFSKVPELREQLYKILC